MSNEMIINVMGLLVLLYIGFLIYNRTIGKMFNTTDTPDVSPSPSPSPNNELSQEMQERILFLQQNVQYECQDNASLIQDIETYCSDMIHAPIRYNHVLKTVGDRLRALRQKDLLAYREGIPDKEKFANSSLRKYVASYVTQSEKFRSFYEAKMVELEQIDTDDEQERTASKRVLILGCQDKAKKMLATMRSIQRIKL